eukprot:scaffold9330_cov117-Isochrysis_galbana.AAC.13
MSICLRIDSSPSLPLSESICDRSSASSRPSRPPHQTEDSLRHPRCPRRASRPTARRRVVGTDRHAAPPAIGAPLATRRMQACSVDRLEFQTGKGTSATGGWARLNGEQGCPKWACRHSRECQCRPPRSRRKHSPPVQGRRPSSSAGSAG